MKNRVFFKIAILILFILITFVDADCHTGNKMPDIKIKAGIACISGSISNLKLPEGEKKVSISFTVINPVSGVERKYTTNLNENNRFKLNIPLECTTAMAGFNVESETNKYGYGLADLNQDKTLQLDIVFDEQGTMKIETKGGMSLRSVDLLNIPKALTRFVTKVTWGEYYKMTPKEFSEYELNVNLKKRISFALDSLQFSDEIINYLSNSFNLQYLKGRLFYYKESAEKSHLSAKDSIAYTAVEPDKSYYSFLRHFNLNDPQLLYTYSYTDFIQKLLTIEALKIPPINDTPIDKWLTGVKSSMKDVIGFDKGFFYDMLVVNAYTFQMNYKVEPLSKKQIENVKNYFKFNNKEIAGILLKSNEEVIKALENSTDLKINNILTIPTESEKDNHKNSNRQLIATLSGNNEKQIKTYESNTDLKINDSLPVSKEKLMETIISKYRGKVVLVDFWATWCGPCKGAITDMKPLKTELKEKRIVFVYISDESSPRITWEYEIKAIGGEQYYLTKTEANYLWESFGFNGIPSYLIYDKTGELKHKFTGFPGVDKMKEKIEELLP